MSQLTPIRDALEKVLGTVNTFSGFPLAGETISLEEALGRVLFEDVQSGLDVPPTDNSAMDGYALRYADVDKGLAEGDHVRLAISQRIAAGAIGSQLDAGQAARIFTGASIPPGADAVVMQEDVTVDGDAVCIHQAAKPRQNIRNRGQDIAKDEKVFSAGRLIQPADLGLLASLGESEVNVTKKIKVAVMSTGDELVEPGQPVADGQIYNSNRYALLGLVNSLGCEFVDLGIVKDDPIDTENKLRQAIASADVIITSGGVSVGEEDHVKNVVERIGSLDLWKLAIKPGKPLAFGRLGEKPFFGLPGNPVSTYVTFCLIVRPFLLKALGREDYEPVSYTVKAKFSRINKGVRQDYMRATLVEENGSTYAELFRTQSSGVLSSVSQSTGLVVMPPGADVQEGQEIQYLPITSFLT